MHIFPGGKKRIPHLEKSTWSKKNQSVLIAYKLKKKEKSTDN